MPAGFPSRRDPADPESRRAGSQLRSRLRPGARPRGAPAHQPEHVPRVRGLQRGAGARGCGVTLAPSIRALGCLSARERRAGGSHERPPHTDVVLSLARPGSRGDRSRRATRECLLALAAVDAMLEDAGAKPAAIAGPRTALIYATAAGYAPSNRHFIEGGGSIHFAYTAPAVVPAEVAIEFGVTGPYAIFLGGPPATLRAIWQAAILLEQGMCDRALVLAVEIFEECADLCARARRLTRWPLVEVAASAWLERGQGQLSFESTRGAPSARQRGEAVGASWSCDPLVALDRWRRAHASDPLELRGSWLGEQARLVWSEAPAIAGAAVDAAEGV
ncbi:MAG: hypothetical protein C5B48_02005 [Candidatus Rokuibacteriota bacterium]|nr:MAG: hypothetical protein C5B48_02005 [Candidatus Rokubacteria bacterium]